LLYAFESIHCAFSRSRNCCAPSSILRAILSLRLPSAAPTISLLRTETRAAPSCPTKGLGSIVHKLAAGYDEPTAPFGIPSAAAQANSGEDHEACHRETGCGILWTLATTICRVVGGLRSSLLFLPCRAQGVWLEERSAETLKTTAARKHGSPTLEDLIIHSGWLAEPKTKKKKTTQARRRTIGHMKLRPGRPESSLPGQIYLKCGSPCACFPMVTWVGPDQCLWVFFITRSNLNNGGGSGRDFRAHPAGSACPCYGIFFAKPSNHARALASTKPHPISHPRFSRMFGRVNFPESVRPHKPLVDRPNIHHRDS